MPTRNISRILSGFSRFINEQAPVIGVGGALGPPAGGFTRAGLDPLELIREQGAFSQSGFSPARLRTAQNRLFRSVIDGVLSGGGSSIFDTLSSVSGDIFGAILSGTKTSTSIAETERSRQAAESWRLSRGQQASALAQYIRRGTRNL